MSKAICCIPRCEYWTSGYYCITSSALTKRGIHIIIPPLWRHYMEKHSIVPHSKIHTLIMQIKLDDTTLQVIYMEKKPLKHTHEYVLLDVMFDRFNNAIDHQKGGVDYGFINHLNLLLAQAARPQEQDYR